METMRLWSEKCFLKQFWKTVVDNCSLTFCKIKVYLRICIIFYVLKYVLKLIFIDLFLEIVSFFLNITSFAKNILSPLINDCYFVFFFPFYCF